VLVQHTTKRKEMHMQCIKTVPSSKTKEEQCTYPPYVQSQTDKREVLCRFHLMDKVVRHAHEKKQTVEQTVADLNIS
jgi:hypothetical protein